jgi:anti-sigma28 factor (negative regulator of flagellin synthesis)
MFCYNALEGVAMVRDGMKDRRQRGTYPRVAAASASPQVNQRGIPAPLIFRTAVDEARANRLEYLRGAVAAGTYHIDSLTIADRVIDRMLLFRRSGA